MFNYYELFSIAITSTYCISRLKEEFLKDYREAFNDIKITDSKRKAGIKAFFDENTYGDTNENTHAFCTSCQVIVLKNNEGENVSRRTDISKIAMGLLQDARPCEIHLKECFAIGKSIFWKYGKKDYYIEVEDNYYCLDRLWEVYRILGGDIEYAKLSKDRNAGLILQNEGRLAIVLPFRDPNKNPYLDCSAKKFMDTIKKYEAWENLRYEKEA